MPSISTMIRCLYKEGTQTVTFGEATEAASEGNGSDLDCFTAPENAVKSKDFMAFLFCEPWVHGCGKSETYIQKIQDGKDGISY